MCHYYGPYAIIIIIVSEFIHCVQKNIPFCFLL